MIGLSPDADAVVALKTKVVWFCFFFTTDALFHINTTEAAEEEPPQFDLWCSASMDTSGSAKIMARFILQSANKNKRFIKRQVPSENLFS